MTTTTTTRANRIAMQPYTPPDLTVPETAAERHAMYARAILAAVKFMESRISLPDEDTALDAAKTLLHLEETRLRHGRAVADAPAPKPPSTTPQLPPIRPIRRPDDLVGVEVECWFGDMMGDVLGEIESPTPATNNATAARILRSKLAIVEPNRVWTDEEIAIMLQQLLILKADDDARSSPLDGRNREGHSAK